MIPIMGENSSATVTMSQYSNVSDLLFNVTSSPVHVWPKQSLVVTIFKTLAMLAVIFSAVFGNILVMISVFRFERLRIIANYFIASLALADLTVALLVMPFNASMDIFGGRWIFGRIMCDIFNGNDVMFSTASLLHLGCISVDRYIAIMDPFHYESKMTKARVVIMLCIAWGASALISHIPIQLGWYTTAKQNNALDSNSELCTFIVNKPYAAISSSISFWIPTAIMVFTYIKIFREARRQEKQIRAITYNIRPSADDLAKVSNGNGNSPNNKEAMARHMSSNRRKMRREHKAAKTLGIIMGAFLCCWLPFFLWYFITTMCGDACPYPDILGKILFWVGYCNSALNPIIYAFFNREFRNAFKRLLRCNSCAKRSCGPRGSNGEEEGLAAYGSDGPGTCRNSRANLHHLNDFRMDNSSSS